MTRKVWITGLVLVGVGILAVVLLARPPMVQRMTPMDDLVRALLGLVPVVGSVCATVGAVMIALVVAARIVDRPLPTDHPMSLLLAGLGVVVLGAVISVGVGLFAMSGTPLTLLLTVAHLGRILELVGSVLLALWLAGRLVAPAPRRSRPLRHTASA